jgi:hypothetical protein
MIPESIGAVLMIGHFIVSIFNVQLGAPVIYTMPFETMEQCEFYGKLLPTDMQIDLEWKHSTRYQCYTIAQFQQMQQQRQPQQQQQDTAPGPQKANSDRGV